MPRYYRQPPTAWRACGGKSVSHGSITQAQERAPTAGIPACSAVGALSDDELEAWLYPSLPRTAGPPAEPDFAHIALELRRKGVTLERLHQEYLAKYPDGLRQSAFCARYRAWNKARGGVMRQTARR